MNHKKLQMRAIYIAALLIIYSLCPAHTLGNAFDIDKIEAFNSHDEIFNENSYVSSVSYYSGFFITPKIIITLSGGDNETSEDGTTDEFVVSLNRQPGSNVVINITGLDATEGNLDKTQLIFTNLNWNIPQTVSIIGQDDALIDGDISYTLTLAVDDASSDDVFDGLSEMIVVTNIDNDFADILISATDGTNQTSEAGTTDEFSVVLNSEPLTDVVLNITGLDGSEGSLDKSQLTFNDSNWDNPQTVIVTGEDDELTDGDIIYSLIITVDDASSDDDYDGLSKTVDVTNLDDDAVGIIVTLTNGNNQTSETGTTDEFNVVLNSEPLTNVVIDITGLDGSEGSLDKTQLIYNNVNWNVPQTVAITGEDDVLADGDITYTLNLVVDDANSDDDYDGLSETVDVTNIDDDSTGIAIISTGGNNETSETGTTDEFSVVLNSEPGSDVVIDITGLDASEGSLDKTQLIFTDSNWDIPQTCVVTGVDDELTDGDITYTLDIIVNDASSDDGYDGIIETVNVTNLDDDTVGIIVTSTNGNNETSETGTTDEFNVVLNSEPLTNVVIDITGLDASEGSLDKTQLIFNNVNWNVPQTVTITGKDDALIDGDISYTLNLVVDDVNSDDDYDGLSKTVDVINIDDDSAGITIVSTNGNNETSETGTIDEFSVVLDSEPATDVVIDISGLDTTEGSLDKTQLVFNSINWDVPQVVTITGEDDVIIDGDIIYTLNIIVDDSKSDDDYKGISETQKVVNIDDDYAGITVTTSENMVTSESGSTDNFSVMLNTQPKGDVVINITEIDDTEGSLDKTRLKFTNNNWNTPQVVTVTGVDDALIDGDITYPLILVVDNVSSNDEYDGISDTVYVKNIDNDYPGILVTPTQDSNITSETGTTDEFEVVLQTQPVDKVVIDLTGIDETEGSLDKSRLVFTNSNWNVPQTVTVTGKDDAFIDGDITYTITLTVNDAGSDDEYDGMSETVDVKNLDDDAPGISIEMTNGNNVTSETGTTDEFKVVLISEPLTDVIIDIIGLDDTEGSLDVTQLIFTNTDWDIPQTVTITGIDDTINDGDIDYTLTLIADNNSDDDYDGLFQTVNVTNIDDDENRAPEINGETITIFEGETATDNLLTNDSDPDGDNLIITTTPVTDASNGTVIINTDGTFTYTPDDGFTGTDSFTYEVCDDGNPQECSTATVTITVTIKDTDNDGIPDDIEGDDDIDNDGKPNYDDDDSDGDGIPDSEEGLGDCDDDGIYDAYDPDPCEGSVIIVPEGFSPNNDGVNDYFVIPGIEQYDRVSILIFNRWGNIVYENNRYANDWDGKSNSNMANGKDLPTGTYFYHVIINDHNERLTGYVYLNR